MVVPGTSRDELVNAQSTAMREYNANAVLLQDAIARSVGMTGASLQVVGVLMSEGPTTPGLLATRTGLTAGGAITTLLDRLERDGYVTRRRDDADRRRVLVEAVPEKVIAEVGPIYARIGERWATHLQTLSDEQLVFATELMTAAAEINHEEIGRLRRR